jgi:hypothetical protein
MLGSRYSSTSEAWQYQDESGGITIFGVIKKWQNHQKALNMAGKRAMQKITRMENGAASNLSGFYKVGL